MSNHRQTFLDDCLSGDAFLHEIDDYIDRWHDGDGAGVPLAKYLGMTPEEYAVWVEKPTALNYIVFARREHIPFEDAIRWSEGYSLAARAPSSEEAKEIVEWLKATGRLPT